MVVSATISTAGERFTDNGDGTVTDHDRQLMWAKTDNQGDINWHQATMWVKYTFPDTIAKSYDNWRLPTLDEIRSLYVEDRSFSGYETDCGMRVRIVPEIQLSCGWVWTSEPSSISAMGFHFDNGFYHKDRKVLQKAYRALPVRNLE
jgi:hypothetical protein